MPNYRIKRLSPARQLPRRGVVVFIGATGSGKTALMMDMLYHLRNEYSKAVVICGSKETEQDFARVVPDLFIWDKFDLERLNAIYDKQELDVYTGRSQPLLVVLDDFMYQARSLQRTEVINRIFMNGRHANILFFVSMQYCKSLSPTLRQQTRMAFVLAEKNPANRVRVFDAFNTCFPNKTEFDALMRTLTFNWQAMVLSNMTTGSAEIEDNVFWYKARLDRRFRFGPEIMWTIHEQKYDPQYYLRGRESLVNRVMSQSGVRIDPPGRSKPQTMYIQQTSSRSGREGTEYSMQKKKKQKKKKNNR